MALLAHLGDDEHSDFFHESECSIEGIIPWWENERLSAPIDDTDIGDPNFQHLLTGSYEHMSHNARTSFQSRLCTLMGKVCARHYGNVITQQRIKVTL